MTGRFRRAVADSKPTNSTTRDNGDYRAWVGKTISIPIEVGDPHPKSRDSLVPASGSFVPFSSTLPQNRPAQEIPDPLPYSNLPGCCYRHNLWPRMSRLGAMDLPTALAFLLGGAFCY